SLFVSLTLVPFLYLNLGARKAPSGGGRDKQGGIYAFYRKVIGRLFKYKVYIIAIMIVLFVSAVIAFRTIDMNLFETQDENKFTVHVELPTGARLGASDEVVNTVEAILEDIPEVETLSTRIEKWSSRIHVTLKDVEKRERSKEELKSYLRPQFENIDAFIYFQEPNEMAEQEVFIEIFGYNYDKLRELATEVGQRMRGVEGMEDVKLRMREGRPEKVVVPDRRKLALTGLSISDLAQNLHSRIRGLVATRFHEHAREIEVIVRQHKPTISEFEQFFATELMSPAKVFVRLNQFADFIDAEAPSEIWRKNRQRMVQVSGTRNDISLEKAVRDIELNLEPMDFPENYFYDIGGDYDFMMESRDELFTALALTVLLVYLVLGAVFESYTQPFIIMVAVPMSFIGVVAALLITKSMVSMGVIMGVIMLAGIVVNNSIMLIDRINSLKADMPLKAAVIEGASQRLRPILMTTITTILGLLPLALKGGEGSGLWQPLSIAVIGGMMTSTFLVLIAIPCIYILIEDAGVKAKEISKYL
ncbi:MAG: efflux RND transporter permease subunit, partial [Elusimicrobiota bacterium]